LASFIAFKNPGLCEKPINRELWIYPEDFFGLPVRSRAAKGIVISGDLI